MIIRLIFALLLLVSVLAIVEPAAGQHFDMLLARPAVGAKTVIGGADVDALSFDGTTRVFEAEMGDLGSEFVALEPGVYHPNLNDPVSAYPASAAGLQPGDVLRLFERDFDVNGLVDDLFYWDGAGAVTFTPATADFRVDDANPLPGSAGVGGQFDDHPFLVIDSDAMPGIYLASVFGVVDGFEASDPVYLVFSTSEDFEEAHELAAEWVQSNLAVPEPASIALAIVAGVVVSATRRARFRAA